MSIYRLDNVAKIYGEGPTRVAAVDGVDLEVDAGEFVAIVGPSGCGKTTMLQLLGALDRPTGGVVAFERSNMARMGDGELAGLRRSTLGFIFQQFNLLPTLTARQNVEAALAPVGAPTAKRQARAGALLEQVGLAARADHLPSQLSGGEQQRVAIARALANGPRVVLADEPTGNLDSATGEEIMRLLETHDRSIAENAPRVVRMRDGRIEADGPTGALRAVEEAV